MLATTVIEVDGRAARVSCRAATAGAPTVLFLPGYPDTLQVFARACAALEPRVGYLALDFPGQGGSERSRDPTFAPEARARWIVQVLRRLEVGRVVVYAHDMGAHAALELALLIGARVSGLVVANALLDGMARTSRTIALLRRARAYRVLLPAFPGRAVAHSIAGFLPRGAPLSPAVQQDIESAFSRTAAVVTGRVCDAAEVWLARGLERFRSLRMPVTLLWGSAEQHFPRVHAEALATVIDQARVVDVPGGHHWLVWHDPDAVVRQVQALTVRC